jgi:hypothetical protein
VNSVKQLVVAPDGSWFATTNYSVYGGGDPVVRIWDPTTGRHPDRIMASIRYRDRIRPEDDAWPLEVTPDPRAAVRTVARTAPARNSAAVRAGLGLVSGDYIERVIAMVTDSGMVLATSHTYVPASVDGDLHDASWRLAEVGRFARPN